MTEIEIPFRDEFLEPIALGQKIMTTRSKKYGEPGDVFWVPWRGMDVKLVLLAVFRTRLWHVAYQLHDAEGLRSPDDFIKVWNKIHPRKKYKETEQHNFWVHVFTPAEEWAIPIHVRKSLTCVPSIEAKRNE